MKIIRILCNRLKNNRIKQRSTVIKIRKRNKTYCQTDMNLTKISYPKLPTKNPQNHETEMKTRTQKRSSYKPTAKQKTPATLLKRMCDKKGGCAQNLCLKSSSPSEKYIFSQNKTPLLNLEYRYIFFIRYY